MAHKIMRLTEVKLTTGNSRSTIYLGMNRGTFPKPISLGARAVGWLESDIQDWLCQRVELSRLASAPTTGA